MSKQFIKWNSKLSGVCSKLLDGSYDLPTSNRMFVESLSEFGFKAGIISLGQAQVLGKIWMTHANKGEYVNRDWWK